MQLSLSNDPLIEPHILAGNSELKRKIPTITNISSFGLKHQNISIIASESSRLGVPETASSPTAHPHDLRPFPYPQPLLLTIPLLSSMKKINAERTFTAYFLCGKCICLFFCFSDTNVASCFVNRLRIALVFFGRRSSGRYFLFLYKMRS